MKANILIATFCATLMSGFSAQSQELAFVIRHGEKELTVEDPLLSEAGRERVHNWAELLGNTGIDVVIHTDAARSRETSAIISAALDVAQVEVPMTDTAGLMDLLAFDHAKDTVLVIAHTETIPGILFQMGVSDLPDIESDDFANLFLVAFADGEDPVLVKLRMP